MKKNHSSKAIEADAAFAADLYRDRAALNGKAQQLLAAGSRQVTIRLSNSKMARAKQQAEAKGLRYQTYMKMLPHEALLWNPVSRLRPIVKASARKESAQRKLSLLTLACGLESLYCHVCGRFGNQRRASPPQPHGGFRRA